MTGNDAASATATGLGTVLVSPDKFRGSLTARSAAESIAAGLHTGARLRTDVLPVADGGEGTLDCLLAAGFRLHPRSVAGPDGEPVEAHLATRDDTAVIESAQACGLDGRPPTSTAALSASSYGVGQLIGSALDMGYRTILVGVGGTASTDGGAGLLQALGADLRGHRGTSLPRGGDGLAALRHVDLTSLDPRLAESRVSVATDVDNPLLGPTGAVATFGPQKGCDAADLDGLEASLRRWAEHLDRTTRRTASGAPGSGAGGGISYALMAVGAQRVPGADAVLDLLDFDVHARPARLVVTGEGAFDATSLGGKAPVSVARRSRRLGVPVVVVAGRAAVTDEQLHRIGIGDLHTLTDIAGSPERSMRDAARLLEEVGRRIAVRLADPAIRAAGEPLHR